MLVIGTQTHRGAGHMDLDADEPDDAAFIGLILQGDRDSWTGLVRKYFAPEIIRVKIKFNMDDSSASDIVQTAFVTVFQKLATFDSTRPFGPWFRTIVNNAANTHHRRPARHREVEQSEDMEPVDMAPSPFDIAGSQEVRQQVLDCLSKLDDEVRGWMVLRYWDDLTEREIANLAGCPEGTVASRLSRARRKIERCMEARDHSSEIEG